MRYWANAVKVNKFKKKLRWAYSNRK